MLLPFTTANINIQIFDIPLIKRCLLFLRKLRKVQSTLVISRKCTSTHSLQGRFSLILTESLNQHLNFRPLSFNIKTPLPLPPSKSDDSGEKKSQKLLRCELSHPCEIFIDWIRWQNVDSPGRWIFNFNSIPENHLIR